MCGGGMVGREGGVLDPCENLIFFWRDRVALAYTWKLFFTFGTYLYTLTHTVPWSSSFSFCLFIIIHPLLINYTLFASTIYPHPNLLSILLLQPIPYPSPYFSLAHLQKSFTSLDPPTTLSLSFFSFSIHTRQTRPNKNKPPTYNNATKLACTPISTHTKIPF